MDLKSYPSSHVCVMSNCPSEIILEFAAHAFKQQSNISMDYIIYQEFTKNETYA